MLLRAYLFTNFSLVVQNFQVSGQCTSLQDHVVEWCIRLITEGDIILERRVLYPSLLGYVRQFTLQSSFGLRSKNFQRQKSDSYATQFSSPALFEIYTYCYPKITDLALY